MTASEPPVTTPGDADEPAPPQRGLTREERGRDVSEAQAKAEAETSTGRRLLRSMSRAVGVVLALEGMNEEEPPRGPRGLRRQPAEVVGWNVAWDSSAGHRLPR
jgi:hypothetical protein